MQLFQREMTYHRWLCMRGRPQPLSGQLKFCRFFFGHYIGQKVHSGSSVRYYGITRVNFWANTVLLFLIVSVELCPSHTKEYFTRCRLRALPGVDIGAVEIQAYILWAPLLVFWCRFLLPGFPAQQTCSFWLLTWAQQVRTQSIKSECWLLQDPTHFSITIRFSRVKPHIFPWNPMNKTRVPTKWSTMLGEQDSALDSPFLLEES